MEQVLVTGGAGFIGSHLTDALLEKGYHVIVLDNLSTGKRENLPLDNENILFVEGSVTDSKLLEELFRKYCFSYIFHFAAVASVQESIVDPVGCHQVNFDATLYLLEEARKLPDLKRFIFVSSAAVYGDKPSLPCREDDAVNPISPYGVDKYASERYVLNYYHLYGLPTVAFRFFNVYGPRQNPGSPYSGVLSIFIDKFLTMDNPVLKIFGDGRQTRDFVYVKDVIDANLLVMKEERAVGKVFNVGTGRETSLLDMVGTLEEVYGKKAEVVFESERAGDIRRSVGDVERLRAVGWNEEKNLKSAISYFDANRNR